MNRFYQPAYWLFQKGRGYIRFASLLLLVTISACDGGIFGTGDGGDNGTTIIPSDMSPDNNGAAPTDPPSGIDGAVTDGATTDGSTTGGATTDGQATPPESPGNVSSSSFNNTISTTSRDDALVRVVNAHPALQDSIVVTINAAQDSPLLPLPGLDYIHGSSDYLSLSPDQSTSMEILLAENFRAGLFDLSRDLQPLELATGSITTVIVRETPATRSGVFDVLPLTTQSTSGGATASLRVVHAAGSIAGTNEEINVIVFPAGGTADQAVAQYEPLEYTRQPNSEYVEITPGQYTIQINNAGTEVEITSNINPISLAVGQTATVVIRDTQTGNPGKAVDALLLEDSTLP